MQTVAAASIVRCCIWILLFACASSVAAAEPGLPASTAALVSRADVILSGRVGAIAIASENDAIYSYVTLDVDEVLKGWLPERQVILKQLGRRVGDDGLVIDRQGAFLLGEEVLVFLEIRPADRTLSTVGRWQGKWNLARDALTGERIARRPHPHAIDRRPFGIPVEAMSVRAIRDVIAALPAPALAEASRVEINVHPREAGTAAPFPAIDATDVGVPAAPSHLLALVILTGASATVDLTWTAPAVGSTPASYVIEAGSAPGLSDLASVPHGLETGLHAPVPLGLTIFVRVRAVNAAGSSAPSNEVHFTAGVGTPPGPPTLLTVASSNRGAVELLWFSPDAGDRPFHYVIQVGSSAGATDLATVVTRSSDTHVRSSVPIPGIYYVRVHTASAAGVGPPSNEVAFFSAGPSGTCVSPQFPPTALVASVSGSTVTLRFDDANERSGLRSLTYVVEVGSAPGLSDLASFNAGASVPLIIEGVPKGTYFARVKTNSCGVGPASNQVVLTVN